MPETRVTVVVPTLAADSAYLECLQSLARQTRKDIRVVVVDNSGSGRVSRGAVAEFGAEVMESGRNLGFGAAINLAWRHSDTAYLATLNDDAVAQPGWMEALLRQMEEDSRAGMCASRVCLASGGIDSAGMLISGDGTSKQRGQGDPPSRWEAPGEVLCPSGSAAIYRRAMLDEIGLFDEDFFLYCEDTDLGLRARRAGWRCLYVPGAVVEHRYSHSAGRASPLKAYLVERNRLFVVVKNFPLSMLLRVPFHGVVRYFWHAVALVRGEGAAGQFRHEGNSAGTLPWLVVRAHCALLSSLARLLRQRRAIRGKARLSAGEFTRLLHEYWISPRQVAGL